MPTRQIDAAQRRAVLTTRVASAIRESWRMIAPIWRGRQRSEDPTSPPFEDEARKFASRDEPPGRYQVRADARRAMLYRRLQRRFPLRIAAPR